MSDGKERRIGLVTGGSRGIGRGIVLELARCGMDVAIVSVSADPAVTDRGAYGVKSEVEALGRRAVVIKADVAAEADWQRILDEALAAYGAVDLLVNNAGVSLKQRFDMLETTTESYDRVMGINLRGPFFLTQLVARRMIEQAQAGRGGPMAIVFVSSISAYTSSVNRAEYCISKAGLAMCNALFADRLAEHGIGAYEIRPGIIATDMTAGVKDKYDQLILEGNLLPQKRWGQPEDVGRAVAAIARGDLAYSTGQVINVDGGFHLRRL
ncbi:MAG: 3-ketoacyl-ACP reductase [Phycisphaerae bacterium]|nr:3-ketoacyl-ACP reductase [Phycisphaerae bacterium]